MNRADFRSPKGLGDGRPLLGLPVSRGWVASCLLILGLPACEPEGGAPAQVNLVPAAPPKVAVQEYSAPPNPDCAPDREERFSTHGNRWGRSGSLCIDQVVISFDAFPDPSLGYMIRSERCPEVRHFARGRAASFFKRPVPEQIGLLRIAVADDLREFARSCRIKLDPAPFVDERFERFYLDYGDGWWFDRVKGGIRLTPNG